MDRSTVNTLGICAGVGMLDLGVATALEHLGFKPRAAALCEWEAYAASVLLERMEDASLEPCPIWCGDLRDFDGTPFRGVVDLVAAGLPCQPYSVAGKQVGLSDNRSYGEDGSGPIPQFLRIVRECRPAVVFCENVPPWVLRGYFRPVGDELSRIGYKIEDPLFITAESVGASHKRDRVFVMAHAKIARRLLFNRKNGSETNQGERKISKRRIRKKLRTSFTERTELRNIEMVNTESGRAVEPVNGSDRKRISADALGPSEQWADAFGSRPQERSCQSRDAEQKLASAERDSVTAFAPGPNADWGGIHPHKWPTVEPGLCVLVDGSPVVVDASRADQLRCAGNGCVPLQAAVAFVELFKRVVNQSA